MSQKGSSSIVSGETYEYKYKKALGEIQKIHHANKVLKNQSEQIKHQYERELNDMAHALQQAQKQYELLKNDKADTQRYLEQLQASHEELRKEYEKSQLECGYLSDALNEQGIELKKLQAFKDEKGLATLISSYEERQAGYKKDVARQEQMMKSLKGSYQSLEAELSEERRQRFKLQDLNNNLKIEVNRYRDLNNNLLAKNEAILGGLLSKSGQGKERFRQVENVLVELNKQLEVVKNTRMEQGSLARNTVSLDSYESVLQDKSRAESEVQRLRERLQEYDTTSREMFEMQQKMKKTLLKCEQLQDECNMLKSKIIVVETKEFMDGLGQDAQLKDFQEKVIANLTHADPLNSIKNSSDSSHFQLMKGYVVELKEKVSKAVVEKRQYEKKYKSLREKLGEKAEKAIGLEEQNKLLRGKLQSYERLAERLQFQLQRSLQTHQEEMGKMKNITNNILTKKTEETKVANAFIKAQLDLELDKFEKVEKGLKQEIETLRLKLNTESIKSNDLQQKLSQAEQFLGIYKKKFTQLTSEHQQNQETNQVLQQNAIKYEQMYREEKAKNEVYLSQKQMLSNKINQLTEENERFSLREEEIKLMGSSLEFQFRKAQNELAEKRQQLEKTQNQLRLTQRQLEQKTKALNSSLNQSTSEYHGSLERNYQQECRRNRELEAEIEATKLRLDKALTQSQKVNSYQDSVTAKNNENNDLRRKLITFEKQVGVLEVEMNELKREYESLQRQNQSLKAKMLQSGQQLRKNYENRDLQSKKTSQKLNQELAAAKSELREERRNLARLTSEVQINRSERQRLEELLEQARRKDHATSQQLNELRSTYEMTAEECERIKAELRFKTDMVDKINAEMTAVQDRYFKANQQSTEARLMAQSLQNNYGELRRELSSLKVYLSEIEEVAFSKPAGGTWQEMRERENLANFVQRMKKIVKMVEMSRSTGYAGEGRGESDPVRAGSGIGGGSVAGLTPIPDYLRRYADPAYRPSSNTYSRSEYISEVNSPSGRYDSKGSLQR